MITNKMYRKSNHQEIDRLITFLDIEYVELTYGHMFEDEGAKIEWLQDNWPVEDDFAHIEELVELSTATTYPNFYSDGDLIEIQVGENDYIDNFHQFKQLPDGTLTRIKLATSASSISQPQTAT